MNENNIDNDDALLQALEEESAPNEQPTSIEKVTEEEQKQIVQKQKTTATEILLKRQKEEKEKAERDRKRDEKMDKLINIGYVLSGIFGIFLIIIAAASFRNGENMQGFLAGFVGVVSIVIEKVLAHFKITLPNGSFKDYVEQKSNSRLGDNEIISETNTSITYKTPK